MSSSNSRKGAAMQPNVPSNAPASQRIYAPFSPEQVQRLNEYQTGTHGGLSGHPFPCPNRGDGVVERPAGPDYAVAPHPYGDGTLIATEAGWVCPHCSHQQNWAHSFMADRQASLIAIIGGSSLADTLFPDPLLAIADLLRQYWRWEREGRAGAAIMVSCLLVRQAELQRDRQVDASVDRSLSMWVIYDHPADYPDQFVARRWKITAGEALPTDEVIRAATIDGVRQGLPPGLTVLAAADGDDPTIVETWF